MARVRVALIDDDSGLLTVLQRRFAALDWSHEALPGPVAADELTSLGLHAVIVNPGLTGLQYVEEITTAVRGLALLVCSPPAPVSDRVRALRGGADDWITKPCHPDELVARIQAVLRGRRSEALLGEPTALMHGELAIRPDRFDAYAGERVASLSRKEYELLYELAAAEGRVLPREEIYQRVWGYAMVRGDRSVDVLVRKLRYKLERVSPEWRYVHTHFGVGYRFAAQSMGDTAPVAIGVPGPRQRPAENSAHNSSEVVTLR